MDRGAIVLTSGGADSIPLLYYVTKVMKPKHTIAIHVDYGQRMVDMERFGVEKSVEHLLKLGYSLELKTFDIRWLGKLSTSKLVKEEPIPETPIDKLNNKDEAKDRILWWWDVVRNLQLITIALAVAESIDLNKYITSKGREIYDVYIGIRRETPAPMKDNTPEFIEEMNRVSAIATHFGDYKIYAPFINLDKHAIIRLGDLLGVKWIYTFSCYTNVHEWVKHPLYEEEILLHCGYCSNCRRRALAFKEAEVMDESLYQKRVLPNYALFDNYFIDELLLKKLKGYRF
ncbi:MAG: 7-cyano-7-deazaguanine synthase [Nitrososphaerales archaeon]